MDPVLLQPVAIAGVCLGALASGLVGLGFPVVAVPLMTLAYGLDVAVVVTTLPTLAIDLSNFWANRSERKMPIIVGFATWGMGGALVGVLLRTRVEEEALTVVLIVVIAAYLLSETVPALDLRSLAARSGVPPLAGTWAGVLQSTIGVSGPIVGIYFFNRTETRKAFISSAAAVFAATGVVRATGLAATGAFTSGRLLAGIAISLVALILRAAGNILGRNMEAQGFRRLFRLILALSLLFLVARIV